MVALSCDETALHSDLQSFYDGVRKQFQLVGMEGDPVFFNTPEELEAILKAGSIRKADKVCTLSL
jgi:hypothetical protein